MPEIPTISYDDISARFERDGIKLGDVKRSSRHFEDWHRSHGLPRVDADGNETGSSQIFMQQYDAAPDGRAVRPPYVNFWHWLLDAYEDVPWCETPGGRTKIVPLKRGMHLPRPARTPEEVDTAIAKLIGDTDLPVDMRRSLADHVRQDFVDRDVRHDECLAIVEIVLDIYGDDIFVLMEV